MTTAELHAELCQIFPEADYVKVGENYVKGPGVMGAYPHNWEAFAIKSAGTATPKTLFAVANRDSPPDVLKAAMARKEELLREEIAKEEV